MARPALCVQGPSGWSGLLSQAAVDDRKVQALRNVFREARECILGTAETGASVRHIGGCVQKKQQQPGAVQDDFQKTTDSRMCRACLNSLERAEFLEFAVDCLASEHFRGKPSEDICLAVCALVSFRAVLGLRGALKPLRRDIFFQEKNVSTASASAAAAAVSKTGGKPTIYGQPALLVLLGHVRALDSTGKLSLAVLPVVIEFIGHVTARYDKQWVRELIHPLFSRRLLRPLFNDASPPALREIYRDAVPYCTRLARVLDRPNLDTDSSLIFDFAVRRLVHLWEEYVSAVWESCRGRPQEAPPGTPAYDGGHSEPGTFPLPPKHVQRRVQDLALGVGALMKFFVYATDQVTSGLNLSLLLAVWAPWRSDAMSDVNSIPVRMPLIARMAIDMKQLSHSRERAFGLRLARIVDRQQLGRLLWGCILQLERNVSMLSGIGAAGGAVDWESLRQSQHIRNVLGISTPFFTEHYLADIAAGNIFFPRMNVFFLGAADYALRNLALSQANTATQLHSSWVRCRSSRSRTVSDGFSVPLNAPEVSGESFVVKCRVVRNLVADASWRELISVVDSYRGRIGLLSYTVTRSSNGGDSSDILQCVQILPGDLRAIDRRSIRDHDDSKDQIITLSMLVGEQRHLKHAIERASSSPGGQWQLYIDTGANYSLVVFRLLENLFHQATRLPSVTAHSCDLPDWLLRLSSGSASPSNVSLLQRRMSIASENVLDFGDWPGGARSLARTLVEHLPLLQVEQVQEDLLKLISADDHTLCFYIRAQDVAMARLYEQQQVAVASSLLQTVTEIVGPPGTGKTTTIAALLERLRANSTTGTRTAVVAQSNLALDQLLAGICEHCKESTFPVADSRLLRLGAGGTTERTNAHTPQRLAADAELWALRTLCFWAGNRGFTHHVVDVSNAYSTSSVLGQLMKLVHDLNMLDGDLINVQDRRGRLIHPPQVWKKLLAKCGTCVSLLKEFSDLDATMCSYPHMLLGEDEGLIVLSLDSLRNLYWAFVKLEYDLSILALPSTSQRTARFLELAEVVFLTAAGGATHADMLVECFPEGIGTLIIEEAGKLSETETMLVFSALRPQNRMVLVGDDQQLSSLVVDASVREVGNYAQSFFRRFQRLGGASITLNHQGRAVSEIANLYRHRYVSPLIDLPLKTNHSLQQACCWADSVFGRRLQFVDVPPPVASNAPDNSAEIEMVAATVSLLMQRAAAAGRTGIIATVLTPYRDQLRELAECEVFTSQSADGPTVGLATVDEFQGRESDIILVSLVLGGTRPSLFMRSQNRITVLLSRARAALIMFGSRSTYENAREWDDVLRIVDGTRRCDALTLRSMVDHNILIECSTPAEIIACDRALALEPRIDEVEDLADAMSHLHSHSVPFRNGASDDVDDVDELASLLSSQL